LEISERKCRLRAPPATMVKGVFRRTRALLSHLIRLLLRSRSNWFRWTRCERVTTFTRSSLLPAFASGAGWHRQTASDAGTHRHFPRSRAREEELREKITYAVPPGEHRYIHRMMMTGQLASIPRWTESETKERARLSHLWEKKTAESTAEEDASYFVARAAWEERSSLTNDFRL